MNPSAIAALSFVLAAGLVYALTSARARFAVRLQNRLDRVTGRFTFGSPEAKSKPTSENGLRPDALPTVTRWLGQSDWEPHLRLLMLQADLRLRPAEWIALCLAAALTSFLLGLLAAHGLTGGLLLGAVGAAVPPLVLHTRREARRRRFDTQLPDALMLLTSALRAGYSFRQAIQTVAEELPPPLALEFGWASGEVSLGVPLDVALGRVAARVQSPDLDLVITAILIQLPLGGNLAEVLDAIAETIRERVRVTGEVQTLTAEGRLSAGILIILAPALALALYLKNPNYFQPLLESPLGHILIVGSLCGQIVGGLIIKRMVTLDV
jgi:tight adherence protein B